MKYIIINGTQPILFGDLISHDSLLKLLKIGDEITSAGFVHITIGEKSFQLGIGLPVRKIPKLNISCYGHSTSLRLGSFTEDSEVIKKLIERNF